MNLKTSFKKMKRRKQYSKKEKIKIINEYKMSNISIRQVSIKMGLSHHSILQGWLKNEDKIYSENINQSARRIGSDRTPETLRNDLSNRKIKLEVI